MPGKNLVLKLYGWKWLSANEISVFVNHQYFINRLVSDFDVWNVDSYEWKEQGLTGFLKKILVWANGSFWRPKMAHNSGLALRTILHSEEDQCVDEKNIVFFSKKICLGQMDYLGSRMAHHHNSGFVVRIFWQFCTMKGAERGIEIILMVFLKKKKKALFKAVLPFWPKNGTFP